ncbi:MAG: c-type cytochrome [Gammaproteobacteria bacterium]|jgi:cytochrome c553|nr:c-type cytochrome [Gammaproteobacteria bacterium]
MSDLSRKIQYLVQFVALLSLGLLAFTAAAQPAIVEACKACHAEDGSGVGKRIVPIIAGMPAVHIEEALYAYKDGARQCLEEPVMCETADLLSDENIADLAEYFAAIKRPSLDEDIDAALAAIGEPVHKRLCARCHLPPDDPDAGEVLGPPLHGQRADYLRYALKSYISGTRENLLDEMKEKISLLDDGDVEALAHYYGSY